MTNLDGLNSLNTFSYLFYWILLFMYVQGCLRCLINMFVVSNFYLLRSSFIGSMLRLQRPLFQTSLLFQDWTVHRAKYIKKGKVDIYREHHHYLSICEFYLPWLWVHDFRICRTISYRWRIMCICGSCDWKLLERWKERSRSMACSPEIDQVSPDCFKDGSLPKI